MGNMGIDIPLLFKRRELISNLIIRTLKVRYKNSALGFLWTMINPLMMMLIYWVVIKIIARFPIDFIRFLLTGVIFWQFVAMCTSDAVGSIAGHSNLVKKTYFPRITLPLSMVIANLINFLLSILVLIVLLVIISITARLPLDFSFLWLLPLPLVLQFCLLFGLALIISSASVYFKDVQHIISVVMQALFFLTPIIYPLTMVKERFPNFFAIYLLNPFTSLVTLFKKALLGDAVMIPTEWSFFVSIAFSVIIFFLGLYTFNRLEPYFADQL